MSIPSAFSRVPRAYPVGFVQGHSLYAKSRSSNPSRARLNSAQGPAGSSPWTPAVTMTAGAPLPPRAAMSATSNVRATPSQATSRTSTPFPRSAIQQRSSSAYGGAFSGTLLFLRLGTLAGCVHGAGLARAEVRLDFLRRHRLGVVVALLRVTAHLAHERGLSRSFDALGDDLQPERVTEGYNRRDDRCIAAAHGEVAHERLVDLERIDRKMFEVRERTMPGPKIVDGDANAQRLQLRNGAARTGHVVHDRALGDFEVEQICRNARLRECLP